MSRKVMANALLAALVVAYIALLHSPLRLAGDSPVYLCDAIDLASGRGFHDDHLPPGYPHVLAVLDLIGLGSSVGLVAFNLVMMAAGEICISPVLRREFALSHREVNTICLLSCCSWMWVQLVTFPLSELLYFAVSSMVLLIISLARERTTFQAAIYIFAATLLALVAFSVRTIGAALFVAVAVAVFRTQIARRIVGRRTAIAVFAIGVVLAGWFGYTHRERLASRWYAGALSYLSATRSPLKTTEEIVWWRVAEIGELTQNVSSTAFAPTTPTLPIETISPWVLVTEQLRAVRFAFGGAAVLLILAGVWSRRGRLSPVEGYLLGYMGILLIWPYDDPRFFAPVVPLFLALGWLGLRSLKFQAQNLRRFATVYSSVFCLFGAVALGDSLRVTYFDRQQPWRECGSYVIDIPPWLAAFDHYGGVRPKKVVRQPNVERVIP